jgi:hypothetical protein
MVRSGVDCLTVRPLCLPLLLHPVLHRAAAPGASIRTSERRLQSRLSEATMGVGSGFGV